VTFGGIPDGAIKGKTVTENAVVKQSWTMAVQNVWFNDTNIKTSANYAIPDSSLDYIAMPEPDYIQFVNTVTNSNLHWVCMQNLNYLDGCYSNNATCATYYD